MTDDMLEYVFFAEQLQILLTINNGCSFPVVNFSLLSSNITITKSPHLLHMTYLGIVNLNLVCK
jgi:hypothetical protein